MQSTFDSVDAGPRDAGRASLKSWLWSIGVGAAAAAVLYAAEPGINWLLMTLAVGVALVAVERPHGTALRSRRYRAVALVVVLAGAAAVTDDSAVHVLLLVAILWLGALVACLAAGLPPASAGPGRLAAAPFVAPLLIAREATAVVGQGVKNVGTERSIPPMRGLALALLVVAPLFALLGEADPTFRTTRDELVRLLTSLEGLGRAIFAICVAVALLGYLNLSRRTAERGASLALPVERIPRHTDVERLIVLVSVAALFAVFLGLQVSYLFGNPGAAVASGTTLAEAVHRGFVEMSIVVALTAAVMAFLDRDARRGEREGYVRAVSCLVLVECLVILVSAYHRLSAYEFAYGYTEFRIYVRLYVGFLAVTVLLLAVELGRGMDVARLCWRVSVAALAALALLGYWNHSAWIVRTNAERFARTGQIDVAYLAATSSDGLPEIVRVLPRLEPKDRAYAVARLCERPEYRACTGKSDLKSHPWYEWNLRRSAAAQAITELSHENP